MHPRFLAVIETLDDKLAGLLASPPLTRRAAIRCRSRKFKLLRQDASDFALDFGLIAEKIAILCVISKKRLAVRRSWIFGG